MWQTKYIGVTLNADMAIKIILENLMWHLKNAMLAFK